MSIDISTTLIELGVVLVRENGDELFGKCPMHRARTGKEDEHPSWSINTKSYAHHCFSCGYSGSITTLYADLSGRPPPDDLEWEIAKASVQVGLDKYETEKAPVDEGPNISEWQLTQYHHMPRKLLERRHIDASVAERFEIKWDKNVKCLVIPIRTPHGELMGYQYKQKGSFINYPSGVLKSETLFGFHLQSDANRITVVESPLDAVRLAGLSIPAVATFGASVSDPQIALLGRHFTTVVLAMDNDPAGRAANDYLERSLKRRGCITPHFNYRGLDAKDPGDVTSDKYLVDAWYRSVSYGLLGAP